MSERYLVKEADQYEDHVITEVQDDGGEWLAIGIEDGCFLSVERAKLPAPIRVGQVARFYGRGFGYPVRGLDIDGLEVYYQTEDEYRQAMRMEAEIRNSARRAEADATKAERDARVATLPECFQKRIARFRRNNPDFYWEHEDYEMASCVEAVRIAKAVQTPEGVDAFYKLPWEEQRRLVEERTGEKMEDGHSGNTFGMACRLAHHYLTDERLVFADHAAIAPLTGCECGCPPVTEAELVAAGYEPFPAPETQEQG